MPPVATTIVTMTSMCIRNITLQARHGVDAACGNALKAPFPDLQALRVDGLSACASAPFRTGALSLISHTYFWACMAKHNPSSQDLNSHLNWLHYRFQYRHHVHFQANGASRHPHQ